MKLFEMPMIVTSLLGLCFLSGIDTQPARADFAFGDSTCARTGWIAPSFSADGLEVYFHVGNDYAARIWTARRSTPDGEWGSASDLGDIVNGPNFNGTAWISPNKLELYFASDRPGGYGSADLYVTKRATVNDDWGIPIHPGPPLNSSSEDACLSMSADGLELYFVSNRPGGSGGWDLWMTTRETLNSNWGTPVNFGPTINTPAMENFPCVSPDGLLLVFTSTRPGGYGGGDLYMARRRTTSDAWGTPANLGPTINGEYFENCARISADGSMLYFGSNRPGGVISFDLWHAPVIRFVDFNGDGTVNAADMALLADNWGKSRPLCDIGPFPWGDGVVDEKDLAILMESLMTPGPKAADVPCDVVLSWISPEFAESHDVYFGTSFDEVNNATREDPCGVLVRMGQVETTYDPNELLEFSQTYFWRIDTILGPTNAAVCKGLVLSFTAEPFAHPINNIIARASSSASGSGPEKTVDGSGLGKNDEHSTDMKAMWQSGNVSPHWIQYEFDQVYTLHELWVWNSNLAVEPSLGFGAKDVTIEYSADGTAWTPLEGVPQFARAPGQAGYLHNTVVSFGGVSARYVKLSIEKAWGATPAVGLSEVRFFHIPDRSATNP